MCESVHHREIESRAGVFAAEVVGEAVQKGPMSC